MWVAFGVAFGVAFDRPREHLCKKPTKPKVLFNSEGFCRQLKVSEGNKFFVLVLSKEQITSIEYVRGSNASNPLQDVESRVDPDDYS